MKYIINLVILALIVLLGYALYSGIQEPIKFRDELNKRKGSVTAQLEKIRTIQELHRDIKGVYAGSFDELVNTMTYDSIPFVRLDADPDDPTNPDKFIRVTTYSSAIDSVRGLGIELDGIGKVPYSDNAQFTMQADTMTYQSTLVPVMECMTRYGEFMGPYADARFRQYDERYNPQKKLGFGSMSSPNLEGNWN